ncbi:MAG: redoxin domain-containing protein [Gammaproteobacteria bacterium]|jgi:thiol-disulfide isomerase/thioredoxin|nr:redoxin domain-containing protein [Gammaproteobacteria bacterium]
MRIPIAVIALLLTLSAHAQPGSSFTLENLEGEILDLPEQQEGAGLYFFWASWCPYCKALMPHLQSIADEYGERVTVYALNFRDSKDPAETIGASGYDFVVLPGADTVAESWGVHGTPGLFLVDRRGDIQFDLYQVVTENPPGYDDLNHAQKAARRAPFWAARIREALDESLGTGD